MDNLVPGFASKVFMTTVRDTLGDKPLQWVATSDIGVFAAMAFEQPEQWNKKAVPRGRRAHLPAVESEIRRRYWKSCGDDVWAAGQGSQARSLDSGYDGAVVQG